MVEKLQLPTTSPTPQQEKSLNFGGYQAALSLHQDSKDRSLHQGSKDRSLHQDSIDRRSGFGNTLEEKLQIAQAQLQQLQKLFMNEASEPEIDEDPKEPQIRLDSVEVISYIPEDVFVGVPIKESVESTDPIAIGADFKMNSFNCLRTPSAHKVFVKMPTREFHIWTELVNEEISTSNDREFVVVLWPYDKDKPKFCVKAEDGFHFSIEKVFSYCQESIAQHLIFMPYDKGKKPLMPSFGRGQSGSWNWLVEDEILVFDPGGMYPVPTKKSNQCSDEPIDRCRLGF